MGMSGMYGASDEKESIATIHQAIESGVTLFDTGDFYGMGHNELLLREAIRKDRNRVFVSVKFGPMRGPDGAFTGIDCRPSAIKNFLAYTLQRLGTDHIDLYQPARVDPAVPIEDTIGAVADMIKAGYVRHIGISEASAQTVRRAHAIHPIAALQIEYSILSRDIEAEVLPVTRELGISVVAYGVLSRGLLSGSTSGFQKGDFRKSLPRFQGENLERNLKLVEALKQIAAEKKVSVSQLCIAWVLSRGRDIIPLIGSRTRTQLQEALGAVSAQLSAEDLAGIADAVPAGAVAGTRYDVHQMRMLNG